MSAVSLAATNIVVLTVAELRAIVREEVRAAALHPTDASDVLTREQAAELLQVSGHHLIKLVRAKGVPAHRLGAEWRFRRSELLAWLADQKGSV